MQNNCSAQLCDWIVCERCPAAQTELKSEEVLYSKGCLNWESSLPTSQPNKGRNVKDIFKIHCESLLGQASLWDLGHHWRVASPALAGVLRIVGPALIWEGTSFTLGLSRPSEHTAAPGRESPPRPLQPRENLGPLVRRKWGKGRRAWENQKDKHSKRREGSLGRIPAFP